MAADHSFHIWGEFSINTKDPFQHKSAIWKQNKVEEEFKYLKNTLKISVYIYMKEGVELD